MARLRAGIVWALLAAASVAAAPRAEALPRYSARYEQKCGLCHVNPSGGGLRTEYASERLVPDEIAWHRETPAILNQIDSTLSKFLLIGTDFREMYVGSSLPAGHLNFFQMQGDLYFDFQLDPRVSIYYDRGHSDTYEMFGLGYVLPVVYVKAGRFVPSYGWKFDDHTMFVRNELGLAPPGNSDVGVEAGLERGPIDVQVGLVNGSPGSTLDTDTKVAGVVNAMVRRHVGPFGLAAGVSGYHRPADASDYDTWGGYGYLTWRMFTWLGETDIVERQPAGGATTQALATSHELSCVIRQGLELKATYDFFDPDRHLGSGAKTRWGGGVDFMPYPYLVLEADVRRTTYDNGVFYSGIDATETLVQLHLFR